MLSVVQKNVSMAQRQQILQRPISVKTGRRRYWYWPTARSDQSSGVLQSVQETQFRYHQTAMIFLGMKPERYATQKGPLLALPLTKTMARICNCGVFHCLM